MGGWKKQLESGAGDLFNVWQSVDNVIRRPQGTSNTFCNPKQVISMG